MFIQTKITKFWLLCHSRSQYKIRNIWLLQKLLAGNLSVWVQVYFIFFDFNDFNNTRLINLVSKSIFSWGLRKVESLRCWFKLRRWIGIRILEFNEFWIIILQGLKSLCWWLSVFIWSLWHSWFRKYCI